MYSFFRFDGPLVAILNKIGNIILASILWLLGCIPIVTVGVSSTALYYSMVKAVRADRGYVLQEYWTAYKKSLKKGILLSVGYLLGFLLLYVDYRYAGNKNNLQGLVFQGIYGVVALFLVEVAIYLFPMLSRFDLPVKQLLKMAVFSVFKYLPYTIGCNVILLLLCLVSYYLPLLGIFAFAGLGCYLLSFLVEPVLRVFMPEPETEEEAQAWYYSLTRTKK